MAVVEGRFASPQGNLFHGDYVNCASSRLADSTPYDAVHNGFQGDASFRRCSLPGTPPATGAEWEAAKDPQVALLPCDGVEIRFFSRCRSDAAGSSSLPPSPMVTPYSSFSRAGHPQAQRVFHKVDSAPLEAPPRGSAGDSWASHDHALRHYGGAGTASARERSTPQCNADVSRTSAPQDHCSRFGQSMSLSGRGDAPKLVPVCTRIESMPAAWRSRPVGGLTPDEAEEVEGVQPSAQPSGWSCGLSGQRSLGGTTPTDEARRSTGALWPQCTPLPEVGCEHPGMGQTGRRLGERRWSADVGAKLVPRRESEIPRMHSAMVHFLSRDVFVWAAEERLKSRGHAATQ